jgi:DNA repair exonuclease SbcCD ATPase subunit
MLKQALIEETKKFSTLPEHEQLAKLPELMKLYQTEIDTLLVMGRNQSSIITSLTQKLEHLDQTKQRLAKTDKEKEGLAIELAKTQYDLETANMMLEERQKRIDEFENCLYLSGGSGDRNEPSADLVDDFKKMRAEYDKAMSTIDCLKVPFTLPSTKLL